MDKDRRIAAEFTELLRDLIREELNKRDKTIPCIIKNKNPDGTYDVFLLPDTEVVMSRVTNSSAFQFISGDVAYLYVIQGDINNSFIIGKQRDSWQ